MSNPYVNFGMTVALQCSFGMLNKSVRRTVLEEDSCYWFSRVTIISS